jgi:hypothetical protein
MVDVEISNACAALHHAAYIEKLLAAAGITSGAELRKLAPSSCTGVRVDSELDAVQLRLAGAGKVDKVRWSIIAPDQPKGRDKVFQFCSKLGNPAAGATAAAVNPAAAFASALAPLATVLHALPAAAAAGGTTTATAEANRTLGGKCFTEAEAAFQLQIEMGDRTAYETIGKLRKGYFEGRPVAFALGDYTPELKLTHKKDETYTHMGEQYVRKDATASSIKIDSDATLFGQMERRAAARWTASAFDAEKAALARGLKLTADMMDPLSKKTYVDGGKVVHINAFATPAGQAVQIAKMREFKAAHPHVTIAQLVDVIDSGVEKKMANLMLRGHTLDAAIRYCCEKSPELWSVSLCDSAATATEEGTSARSNTKQRRGDDASESDQVKKLKNQSENLQRQVANLRGKGKGGGSQWGKGGRGNGGWQQAAPPWQHYEPPWWQAGKGQKGGAPSASSAVATAVCPPDVCKDFNFKASGCPRGASCTWKHTCCVCQQPHPCRGNH